MAPPSAAAMTGVRLGDDGFVVVEEQGGIVSRLDDKAHTFVLKAAAMLSVPCRTADGSGTRPYDEIRADIARKLGATRGIGTEDAADSGDDDSGDKVRFSPERGYEYDITPRADDNKADKAEDNKADRDDDDKADDAAQLAALLKRMAGNASVSADEVCEIVRPMIDDATSTLIDMIAEVSRPIVNHIVVRDREPVEIYGRQHKAFPELLTLVNAGVNVMMVGPAGTGKSKLAESVAQALGVAFSFDACAGDLGKHEIVGYTDGMGNLVRTQYRDAYEHGGLHLFDEVDAASGEVTLVLNNAVANGHMAFPDGMVKRHEDHYVLAAANTWGTGATDEFIGRNQLDAAFLDRWVRYPVEIDEDLENEITRGICFDHATTILTSVRRYRANRDRHGLRVVISPRCPFDVAKMVAAGIDIKRAFDLKLFTGLDDATARKIRGGE